MSTSINTNIAAYYAQANIAIASQLAQSSVARLSSGNAIVAASDNVAALATGTSLATQVSALKTALTNASQGGSLLQVADGALGQIQSILQTQQSLALQAKSGSLTDTDRGFLNQQFAALTNEINALATGTTFNGVRLIDGSIATGGSNNPLRTVAITEDNTDLSDAAADQQGGTNAVSAIVKGQVSAGGIDGTTAATFLVGENVNSDSDTYDFNDTSFVGDLSQGVFSVTSAVTGGYNISFTLNGVSYVSSIADLSNANGDSSAYFTLSSAPTSDGAGGTLAGATITINLTDVDGDLTNTAAYSDDADGALAFQQDLTASFAGATSYALHSLSSVFAKDSQGNDIAGSGIRSEDTAGTLLDGFNGSMVNIQTSIATGSDNSTPIAHFSATGVGANVVFSVQINGVTFSTAGTVTVAAGDDITGSVFNDVTDNLAGDAVATGLVTFYRKGDTSSNDIFQLDLGNIQTSAKIDTDHNVQQIVDALNGVFGSGGSAGGLTFQLGTTTTSNVTVNIASAQSSALFGGASLDISSQGGADTAATAVAEAIDEVTAIRAGVGALESQFLFASAALQTSVQNQDAARGLLLDTDISTESTSYATNQVKLQAGISVLAQANQQLQALLKLIG